MIGEHDMEGSDLVVILVDYKGTDLTVDCIRSLKKSMIKMDIVVVNTSINNNSLKEKLEIFDGVVILDAGFNAGFAGGNNIGIKYGLRKGYSYFLILNNDTVVDKNMVDNLKKYCRSTVVTVPEMFYYDSPNEVWFSGGSINKFTGNCKHITKKASEDSPTIDCNFATGCCLMIHRNTLEQIGLFDEKMFMYCEDLDLCIRMSEHKISIKLITNAKLWHKVSSSTGGSMSPISNYYVTRNRLYCIKKHNEYFYPTALSYSLITRYIRMFQWVFSDKSLAKAIKKGLDDYRKGIIGKIECEGDNI